MEKIQLEYTHEGAVARIILIDGKGNILDNIMMKDLLAAFAKFKENKDLKLITFEGEGKNFSFGASVEEHTKYNCEEMLKSFHRLFLRYNCYVDSDHGKNFRSMSWWRFGIGFDVQFFIC